MRGLQIYIWSSQGIEVVASGLIIPVDTELLSTNLETIWHVSLVLRVEKMAQQLSDPTPEIMVAEYCQ